jgi:hypothetical protein
MTTRASSHRARATRAQPLRTGRCDAADNLLASSCIEVDRCSPNSLAEWAAGAKLKVQAAVSSHLERGVTIIMPHMYAPHVMFMALCQGCCVWRQLVSTSGRHTKGLHKASLPVSEQLMTKPRYPTMLQPALPRNNRTASIPCSARESCQFAARGVRLRQAMQLRIAGC